MKQESCNSYAVHYTVPDYGLHRRKKNKQK